MTYLRHHNHIFIGSLINIPDPNRPGYTCVKVCTLDSVRIKASAAIVGGVKGIGG